MRTPDIKTWIFLIIPLALLALLVISWTGSAGERGNCSESGDHDVSDWVRVFATLADPLPPDRFEVIVSVEVHENGSWRKEANSTIGELVRKPDSPSPQVIDRQNGTEEGIRLSTSEHGDYRVWGGVCRHNQSYWNFTNLTILPRNHPPVAIALLGKENGTAWHTNLSVWIKPGTEITIYFNGSLSYDMDGDELDYFWDIDGTPPSNGFTGAWGNRTFSKAGDYTITLTVGDGNVTSEAGVVLIINYSIFPDLVVSGRPILSRDEFKSGETVEVTAIIRNQGNASSGPFEVEFYDHNLNKSVTNRIYVKEIGPLKMNGYSGITFNWTTWIAGPGTHVIEVIIDLKGEVKEENESNNNIWSNSFLVNPGVGYEPVLIIKSMTLSNETPMLFQMVNITLVLNNSGNGPAEWITVKLLVNREEYDIRYLLNLNVGEERTILLFFSSPLLGSYNLTCVVYYRGIPHDSAGRRVVIQDIGGPNVTNDNQTDTRDDTRDIGDLMMWAGVFMIIIAVVIQVIGRKAREKK
ncbi:MAG: hypothetical protein KAU14_07270 [Thermoplasmata archaeon]|nr:hypothetical protein [Thermoplasmata archaeon]